MAKVEFLPLGSVVAIKNSLQKLIIVGRGLTVTNDGKTTYYDYAAAPYPVGMTNDRVAYLNHDVIDLVLYYGYDDDDNRIITELLNKYIEEHPEARRHSNEAE